MKRKAKPYICKSAEGLVQQLVTLIVNEYWFYSAAWIPETKDPLAVDAKLIEKYGANLSPSQRRWKKSQGIARVMYLRHDRFFVLVSTEGVHGFFQDESTRDFRKRPLCYDGYSISFRNGHASVRIGRKEWNEIKKDFLNCAVHWSSEWMERKFEALRYAPYAPVKQQYFQLLRAVNKKRRYAGKPMIPNRCLWLNRRSSSPFIPLPEEGRSPTP